MRRGATALSLAAGLRWQRPVVRQQRGGALRKPCADARRERHAGARGADRWAQAQKALRSGLPPRRGAPGKRGPRPGHHHPPARPKERGEHVQAAWSLEGAPRPTAPPQPGSSPQLASSLPSLLSDTRPSWPSPAHGTHACAHRRPDDSDDSTLGELAVAPLRGEEAHQIGQRAKVRIALSARREYWHPAGRAPGVACSAPAPKWQLFRLLAPCREEWPPWRQPAVHGTAQAHAPWLMQVDAPRGRQSQRASRHQARLRRGRERSRKHFAQEGRPRPLPHGQVRGPPQSRPVAAQSCDNGGTTPRRRPVACRK